MSTDESVTGIPDHESLRRYSASNPHRRLTLLPHEVAHLVTEYDEAGRGAATGPFYLVTVKRARNPEHNPRAKQTGRCPTSPECTDVTGEHHTMIVDRDGLVELRVGQNPPHITRVERVDLPPPSARRTGSSFGQAVVDHSGEPELPFLVRGAAGRAVRAVVARWVAAGRPSDPDRLHDLFTDSAAR